MNTLNVVLYILCTRLFSDVHFTNIFSHSVYCLLVSLWYALKHKSLNFVEVIFFFLAIFLFCSLCFWCFIFEKRMPISRSWRFTLNISSQSFIVFSSVQFSHSVVSDSLRPHESQHTRPPCPSPTPRVYPNSRPSSQWCHPAISSSVIPFSSCPQSRPA